MVPAEVDNILNLQPGAAHVVVAIARHYVHLCPGHGEAVGLVTPRELAASGGLNLIFVSSQILHA